MAKAMSASAPKELPAHSIRLGAIQAAVWKNDTANGVRYNVTFSRRYRDGEDWKSSDAFGRDDLLVVAKAADQAHTWIHAQRQNQGKGKADAPTESAEADARAQG